MTNPTHSHVCDRHPWWLPEGVNHFDPNPTMDSRYAVTMYKSYADDLDRTSPGWEWSRLDLLTPQLAGEASSRRAGARGDDYRRCLVCDLNLSDKMGVTVFYTSPEGKMEYSNDMVLCVEHGSNGKNRLTWKNYWAMMAAAGKRRAGRKRIMDMVKAHGLRLVQLGVEVAIDMPWSEVCMELGICCQRRTVRLLPDGMAQVLDVMGGNLSAPITYAEAGIFSGGGLLWVMPLTEGMPDEDIKTVRPRAF